MGDVSFTGVAIVAAAALGAPLALGLFPKLRLPAIVLEILHPSVVAGVQDLSNYREDPFQRARATLGYVLTTTDHVMLGRVLEL